MADNPASPVRLPRGLMILLGLAAATVVVFGMQRVGSLLGPIFLALVLVITADPLRTWLQRRGLPRWVAAVIVILAVYLVLVALVLALALSVGRLATLLPDYTSQMNELVRQASGWLAANGVGQEQIQSVVNALDVGRLVSVASGILSGAFNALSNFLLIAVLVLFMAVDASGFRDHLRAAGPQRPRIVIALQSFAAGTRRYLGVSALFGFIVALLDGVALWIMSVPGALVWAVLAFVTNFIPNVGFVLGVVPPAVIALLEGGPGLALAVIIVYSVINFVVQTVIQPRFVGDAVGLSATLTFLSLIFWAWLIGALGALLAVPLTLLVKAVLVDVDRRARWMEPLLSGRPPRNAKAEAAA